MTIPEMIKYINENEVPIGKDDEFLQIAHGKNYLPTNLREFVFKIKQIVRWRKR